MIVRQKKLWKSIFRKSQLKPLELAIVLTNSDLTSQEFYNGVIENETIAFKSNGTDLIFSVPTGAPGTKSGTITIDGEDFNFQYELVANTFTNPESYLQNYFEEEQMRQTNLENLLGAFIQDSIPGFEDIQTDLISWEQIATDSQAEIAALSAEEKERLAQLLEGNNEWIQRLYDAILFKSIYSMNRASASECRSLIEQGRMQLQEGKTFTAAGTSIKAYYCSLTFDERQYDQLDNDFDRGTLLFTDIEFTAGLDVLNTLANVVFRKMDAITKELQGSISSNGIAEEIEFADNRMPADVSFRNGEPEELFAKIRFRSINQNDVNTEGTAGEAATFFDQIIISYNEAVAAMNQPLIWRPGFTETSSTRDFNQFLDIPSSSVSNSDVILINTQYVDDKWEVAFGNDGDEEEPTFTFELNYDDGHVQLQKTVSAIISDGDIHPSWATGSWFRWNNQGFLTNEGTGCWIIIERVVNGQLFYIRYYPESFYRYNLFPDGSATESQPTEGCKDVPAETEAAIWSVTNNVLKIERNGEVLVEIENFTEASTNYEYYSYISQSVVFLDFFKR